ncbi:Pullulanase 1, chloroplastic-like protein [Drosera capensis]
MQAQIKFAGKPPHADMPMQAQIKFAGKPPHADMPMQAQIKFAGHNLISSPTMGYANASRPILHWWEQSGSSSRYHGAIEIIYQNQGRRHPFAFLKPFHSSSAKKLEDAIEGVDTQSSQPFVLSFSTPFHHQLRLHAASISLSSRLVRGLVRAPMAVVGDVVLVTPLHSQEKLEDNLSLSYSRAYWPCTSIIAWNVDIGDGSFFLYASRTAALVVNGGGIQELHEDPSGLPAEIVDKFPHIRGYRAFKLPPEVCSSATVVAAFSSDGVCRYATGLQISGALDELCQYDGPLESIALYLWAPTAQVISCC